MSQPARLTRRIVGLLSARLPELELQSVPDEREHHLTKWRLSVVLRAVLVCQLAGCLSLRQAESLTAEMSPDFRRKLGIGRRIPDTTMRTILLGLEPEQLRALLHTQTRCAARRRALLPDALPFNVVMLDGKSTALGSCDDLYAQRQTQDGRLLGVLRTMTCSLVTTAAQTCIDAIPSPAHTNEMGWFCTCVDELLAAYASIDLFRMVAADAGNCSEANASYVRSKGLHYLFALKGHQPVLEAEAVRVLGSLETAAARSRTKLSTGCFVMRTVYLTEQLAGFAWDHLRTVLRVQSRSFAHGRLTASEDRYFVASLPASRLSPAQWLRLIRLLWGVENAVHCTLDKTLREDEHPWIEAEPKGALVVALLRRVAYNLLALFRSVTLRAEHSRCTPWQTLLRWVELALLTAGPDDVARLRPRTLAAVGTS